MIRKLLNKISVGDLVRINSNSENVRRPVYKIYAIIRTKNGTTYIIQNTYSDRIHEHCFNKEELIRL